MNATQLRRQILYLLAALFSLAGASACADSADLDPPSPGGRVAISVAPLSLPGLTDATYTITVANGLGEQLWSRTVTSSRFGDSAGSLSYLGACDADPAARDNTISLTADELLTASGPLVAGVDFATPTPPGDPLVVHRTCLPDRDVSVTFELTIARAAKQGFFDIAVSFSDIFCSAKLDCERADGGPLELLHQPSGGRGLTAVVGFACTAGPNTDTTLWLDDVVVTCAGGGPFNVTVAEGPGNLNPPFTQPSSELLFQSAVYRGVEQLSGDTDWSKAYWNIALGLNTEAFATLGPCTLTTNATASDGPLVGGQTPADTRWPMITWSVPLVNATGGRACSLHQLDGGNGVATIYTPTEGHGFVAGFQRGTGLVIVPTPTCNDGIKNQDETDIDCGGATCTPCANGLDCATGSDCASSFCATTCAWAPSCEAIRQGGVVTSAEYTIDPDGSNAGGTYTVFCDMATEGGGWTLFRSDDIGGVTGVGPSWLSDDHQVSAYMRNPDGSVGVTVLQQLPTYAATALDFGQYSDFFQVFFAPNVAQGDLNGFTSFDSSSGNTDLSFTNCDSNGASYFRFYRAGVDPVLGAQYALWDSWRATEDTFSAATIPTSYFAHVLMAFGGCGALTSTRVYSNLAGAVGLK